MCEFVRDNFYVALVEFGLKYDEFVELTFAEYQDIVIYKNFSKIVEKEEMRQTIMNAMLVIESNKNSKRDKFKDIPLFERELTIYDKTFNDYETMEEVNHKKAREELLSGFKNQ